MKQLNKTQTKAVAGGIAPLVVWAVIDLAIWGYNLSVYRGSK